VPSVIPAPGLGYIRALDGVRGIAVLAVMAFHANLPWSSGGTIGVDIFFVLSGFLITSLLIREHQKTGTINLRNFYARRALRLLPALLALLLVSCVYARFFQPPARALTTYKGAIYSLLYIGNWIMAFGHGRVLGALSHTWSLSIEEQFYLLWPLLLYLAVSRRIRMPWMLAGLSAAIGASALWRAALWNGNVDRVYHGFDTRADALLTGCVVGLLFSSHLISAAARFRTVIQGCAAISALFLIAVFAVGGAWPPALFFYYGLQTLVALAAAFILIALLSRPPRAVTRLLEWPVLVGMGRMSYGLYLWHFPLFQAIGVTTPARRACSIVAAFVVAAASYHFLEGPCLRLKERFRAGGRQTHEMPESASPGFRSGLPAAEALNEEFGPDLRVRGSFDKEAAPSPDVSRLTRV
jgi:peptidoglycan/LPS O-acetylase OafA/YrhL